MNIGFELFMALWIGFVNYTAKASREERDELFRHLSSEDREFLVEMLEVTDEARIEAEKRLH
jgi:hypothetical protein